MIQQPQTTQQQLQQQQTQLNNNNNNNIQEHISSSFPNPIATTSNQVIINFSDGRQVSYAFNQLSEITPSLFSHFNPDEQLYLPSWITVEDLSSFCSIYEKGIEYVTDFMDKTKLLKMSEYFENDNFTFSLIYLFYTPHNMSQFHLCLFSIETLDWAMNSIHQCYLHRIWSCIHSLTNQRSSFVNDTSLETQSSFPNSISELRYRAMCLMIYHL